jgi:hypothetical protein
MTLSDTFRCSARGFAMCGLLFALAIGAGCGGKAAAPPPSDKPKTQASKTNSVAAQATLSNEYVSVFDGNPLGPKDGRDPFYPDSKRPYPKAVVPNVVVHKDPLLVLKAVIRTSKQSQALINNAILEVGEKPQSIRTADGRAMVTCLEIGDNYAVVQVEGEAGPRRLEMEKKKGIERK